MQFSEKLHFQPIIYSLHSKILHPSRCFEDGRKNELKKQNKNVRKAWRSIRVLCNIIEVNSIKDSPVRASETGKYC